MSWSYEYDDGPSWGRFVFYAVIFLLIFSLGYLFYEDNFTEEGRTSAALHEQRRIETECNKVKPHLETSANGIELWCIERGGRRVYFSKSGTHTTHQECHMVGKMSSCRTIDEDVSNTRMEDD